METYNLLEKYLLENVYYPQDTTLNSYDINGSIIKLKYYSYTNGEGTMEVELLDYITWVYNKLA